MVHWLTKRLDRWVRNQVVLYCHQGQGYTTVVRVAERWPFGLLAALAVLMVILPSRVWLVAFIGLALAVGLSFGWAVWSAVGIRMDRRLLHAWVQVGDRLEERFTLINNSSLPILAAEVEDGSDLPGYNASTVRAVSSESQYHWRQHGISHRRGLFRLGPTTIRFSDPAGFFLIESHYPHTREVLVFPPVLRDLAVSAPSGGGQGMAASRQRSLMETAVIGGVRNYQPGDPVRRIHWPLSVRHRMYLVKEFDREMGGDIWIVVDLDASVHVGKGDESTLEYSVVWAASWAWHLLRQGKGVALYTHGPQRIIIPPTEGTEHLWNILRCLATVEVQTHAPLPILLQEVRPYVVQGDSLVVITPSIQPDWPVELTRPGLRAASKAVVLLDAASFVKGQPPAGPALTGIRTQLASLDVPVYLVQWQERLHARPAAPGGGDWEDIVTPWGRVVVRARPAEVK